MRPVTRRFRRAVKQAFPPHAHDLRSRQRLVEALEWLLWEIRQPDVATVEFVLHRDQELVDAVDGRGSSPAPAQWKRHMQLAVTLTLLPPTPK